MQIKQAKCLSCTMHGAVGGDRLARFFTLRGGRLALTMRGGRLALAVSPYASLTAGAGCKRAWCNAASLSAGGS